MSYDYSENILVQESAGNLLQNELGWDVKFAYNTEVLGKNGTFGRESYRDILLTRYFRDALKSSILGLQKTKWMKLKKHWNTDFLLPLCFRSMKKSISSFAKESL